MMTSADIQENPLPKKVPLFFPKEVRHQYQRGELLARYVAYDHSPHAWINYKENQLGFWRSRQREITFNIPEHKPEIYQSILAKISVKGLVCRILILRNNDDEVGSEPPPAKIIVLFQGTACTEGVKRDLDSKSPGESSFYRAISQINLALVNALERVPESDKITMEICSHSLGGADAQRFMANILEKINAAKLEEYSSWHKITVVTLMAFNSPAATKENAAQVSKLVSELSGKIKVNAYYYFAKSDLVHQAGEQHLFLPEAKGQVPATAISCRGVDEDDPVPEIKIPTIKRDSTIHIIHVDEIKGMQNKGWLSIDNCRIAHSTPVFVPEYGKETIIESQYSYLPCTSDNWEDEFLERVQIGFSGAIKTTQKFLDKIFGLSPGSADHAEARAEILQTKIEEELAKETKIKQEKERREDMGGEVEIQAREHKENLVPVKAEERLESVAKIPDMSAIDFSSQPSEKYDISSMNFSIQSYQKTEDKDKYLRDLFAIADNGFYVKEGDEKRTKQLDSTNLEIIKTLADEAVRLFGSAERRYQQSGQEKANKIADYISSLHSDFSASMTNENLFDKLKEILDAELYSETLKALLAPRNYMAQSLSRHTSYRPKTQSACVLKTVLYSSLIKKYNALEEDEKKQMIANHFQAFEDTDFQKFNILLTEAHRLLTTPSPFWQSSGAKKAVNIVCLLYEAEDHTILNNIDDQQNRLGRELRKSRNYFNLFGLFNKCGNGSTRAYEMVAPILNKQSLKVSP